MFSNFSLTNFFTSKFTEPELPPQNNFAQTGTGAIAEQTLVEN